MQETRTKSDIAHATSQAPTVSAILPGALVALFPGAQTHVELRARNVEDLLAALDARWPGMRDRLRDERPSIRKHINIFVDGRRATLETALNEGSKVYILTAMSGG